MAVKLIINAREKQHKANPSAVVSLDIIIEFKEAILTSDYVEVKEVQAGQYVAAKSYAVWRRVEKYIPDVIKRAWFQRSANRKKGGDCYFNIMLGQEWDKCFPQMLIPSKKSVYMFDAWPEGYQQIIEFVDAYQLSHIFISASQSARRLQSMVGRAVFSWIPEGVDPHRYQYRAYTDKDIDVLELGRKYDAYHDCIVDALENDGRAHLYEKTKGSRVFATSQELIDGYARTKISICVPSSITHPDRAGDIETMTIRYLQSMASKCLVVGHAPEEMVELFGYNPVVEIDMEDPVGQIREILENISDYVPLIEKNYTETLANHTWKKRWEQIVGIMQSSE